MPPQSLQPSPPSLDAPTALPVSAHVNLAPYNSSKAEEFHNPKYLAATEGCAHASAAILLSEGQTVSLALESDCPIDWYGDWDNPRAQVGIMFPQMKGLTEDSGWEIICSGAMEARQIMASGEGKRLEVILTVHPDNSGASIPNIYKLLAINLDPDSSHYLKYDISLHGAATSLTVPAPAPAPTPPYAIANTPAGPSTSKVNQTLTFSTSADSNIAGSPEYRFVCVVSI